MTQPMTGIVSIQLSAVMPGFMPGIHVLLLRKQDVDGRDKPGHDEVERNAA
jgi:hypothetical protein